MNINPKLLDESFFHINRYLARKEYFKEIEKQEKKAVLISREIMIANKKEDEEKRTNYPGHNTFLRRPDFKSNHSLLVQAFLRNNPAVVFDFQFEHCNTYDKSIRSLILQLQIAYGSNAKSLDPFRMYFSNFKKDGKFDTSLKDRNIRLDELMIIESEKSYMDLFPKEKIVYLSPNSKNEMKEVDEDKVYIVGVIADSHEKIPHTQMQARIDGIRTERFPLEKYVRYKFLLNKKTILNIKLLF